MDALFFKSQNKFIVLKLKFQVLVGRLLQYTKNAECVCVDLLGKHFLSLEMSSVFPLLVYGQRLTERLNGYVSVSLESSNPPCVGSDTTRVEASFRMCFIEEPWTPQDEFIFITLWQTVPAQS